MSKEFKAAVVGLGNIGFRYTLDPLRTWISSHLEAYKEHPNFLPVAVCDIDRRRLADAKAYQPDVNTYTSWKEMLEREKLDVVSVCVSPELNFEISFSGEVTKLKAIVFEKPLAKDIETGKRIVNRLKEIKTFAVVNYFRRWQGTFIKLKDLVSSGTIGNVQKINGYYPSTLLNGGVHLIDTIQYLSGNFTEIRALGKRGVADSDDCIYSAYGKIGDIEAFITGFDKANYNIFDIQIWGDKGKLTVDNFGTRIVLQEALASQRFSSQKELGDTKEFKADGLGSNFTNLLNNLVSALRDEDESQILCQPEDALHTIKVAEEIVNSYNSGGHLIELKESV